MIRIFPLVMAANEVRSVAVSGEYFEIRNALYPIDVELLDRSGGVISLLEQAEQSDFVKPGLYETIRVTNGPTAQTVRIFYGSGDAGSRRTSGLVRIDGTSSVAVVDGESAKSKAGSAFSCSAFANAVAGQQGYLEIWNPAASGVRCVLSDFVVSAGAVSGAGVVRTAANVVAAGAAASKLSGGAGSVTRQGGGAIAAIPGVLMELFLLPASTPFSRQYKQPFVINPGTGLIVYCSNANVSFAASAQFTEEPYP